MTKCAFVAAASLTLVLTTGARAAYAQASCAVVREVPGVGAPQSLSTFMTGVDQGGGRLKVGRVSYLNYLDLLPRLTASSLTAWQGADVRVSGGRAAGRSDGQTVAAGFVGASFFEVLDIRLQMGKGFAASADAPDEAPRAAVIGDALWASLFNRDPAAVGQTIAVNGREVVVVGIAAAEFEGVARAGESLWLPGPLLPLLNDVPGMRADDRATGGYYVFFARPDGEASWPDVRRELSAATDWLLERDPAENGKFIEVAFHDYGPITCAR